MRAVIYFPLYLKRVFVHLPFVLATACESGESEKKTEAKNLPENRRISNIKAFLSKYGSFDDSKQLNTYFFNASNCIPCTKDKLQQTIDLFNGTRTKSVLVVDNEMFNTNVINNPLVTVIKEQPEVLRKKGMKFDTPCLFIFNTGKVKIVDLDLPFFDNLDSLKRELNL